MSVKHLHQRLGPLKGPDSKTPSNTRQMTKPEDNRRAKRQREASAELQKVLLRG